MSFDPPGAADTAHFSAARFPENAGDKIHLRAKLNYRKFTWFNTHFRFGRGSAAKCL